MRTHLGLPGRAGRRTLRRVASAVGLLAAFFAPLAPASARDTPAAACPPVAQMPTAEQIQAAAAKARDRGFLWKITRDGRTSWLYGTLHLGNLDWALPGPGLRTAIGAVDTLALELDVGNPEVMQSMNQALAKGPALDPLPAELARRLQAQVDAACLPPKALDVLHPVSRAITLTALAARWDGLDPSFGQEFVLSGAARARGLRVVSLETAATQMGALMPPDREQALQALGGMLDQLESGGSRRVTQRLAQAWADQRLAEIERYETWCDCIRTEADRAALKRLNDDRNPGLADGIAALHASGQRVLAAVGALHMVGPQALPRLMTQRGFTVEAVGFVP